MANRKIKFPLWLMPETKATVERLYRQDGCSSQSEFMERAILFYCGYLQSEYAGDFLPKILGETLEAILSMFGDRIGRLLFKQTVEHNVMNHILASDTDIDAATYQKMRGMCITSCASMYVSFTLKIMHSNGRCRTPDFCGISWRFCP